MNNSMENSDNMIQFLDYTDGDFTKEENYHLALESIFRWTLRRDEYTDTEIVRHIKKVAMASLEDVL